MSIKQNVMDFFRPGAAAPAALQTTATNGQVQVTATPSLTGDPATPDLNATPAPLDAFKDLWAAPVKAEGQEEEFNPSQIFNLDPESMKKAVGQIDFASAVTKEQLAAISEGGEGAMGAFVQAMNSVAQTTMTMSTTAAAKMVEQAMTRASGAMDSKIDKQVKANQVSSQMQTSNPALANPAAAPLVAMVKAQLLAKNPKASAEDIAAMANQYVLEFANIAAGKPAEVVDPAKANKTDWDKYLTVG